MTEEFKTVSEYTHPHDKPLLITDLSVVLTEELFLKPPKDVLNTKLHEIVGNKFVAKKG